MVREMTFQKCDESFGAFIVVCTSESVTWCGHEKASVFSVTSKEDFENLGIDVEDLDEAILRMKIGERISLFDLGDDYEGVYVMRVG